MTPRAEKLLVDAVGAAALVGRMVEAKSLENMRDDLLLRPAVERELTILGEALSVLRREHPDVAAQVPDLGKAIGLRHVLVHGYDTVDVPRLWETAVREIPIMLAALRSLLEAAQDGSGGDGRR